MVQPSQQPLQTMAQQIHHVVMNYHILNLVILSSDMYHIIV